MARPLESVRDVSRIGYAFMSSQALFAALEIGLFTELHRQPASVDDLAANLEVVPEALQTILAILVAESLVLSDGGRYSNSPAAERYLVTGAPNDYSEYLRLQVGRQLYSIMPHSVAGLRGDEAAMVERGTGFEGWLADPDEAEIFSRSQHAGSMGPAYQLARRLDLSACTSLLDVGGGSGAFSISLCSANEQLRATIIDFPAVIDVARRYVEEAGMLDRIDFIEGNSLDVPWPQDQDVILMSYLVSAIPVRNHPALVERAWNSAAGGGRLVIHDFMLDDDRSGPLATARLFLAYMPTTPGAASFTGAEIQALVEAKPFESVTCETFIPDITKLVLARKPE